SAAPLKIGRFRAKRYRAVTDQLGRLVGAAIAAAAERVLLGGEQRLVGPLGGKAERDAKIRAERLEALIVDHDLVGGGVGADPAFQRVFLFRAAYALRQLHIQRAAAVEAVEREPGQAQAQRLNPVLDH